MAKYSVATTKDNLSKLIDKALAGEEVIITRHGKPAVELRVVGEAHVVQRKKGLAWLKEQRENHAPLKPLQGNSVLEMRKDYRY
jgi:prevent-host-death family protein